ncbi:FAD-binding oxidoreductase [Streptomyces sp. TR1341]|uniref:FAD-linked oxidase C-terminal domain-containing protein n=1 Tax=Streptomyces sp. TR1341 TaxID=2601266 RepID=UPI00138AC12D|nr:FAD-binding oxidoreductase [Streptomyces sp. TR1341]
MTVTPEPRPAAAAGRPEPGPEAVRAAIALLRATVDGDVDDSARRRAEYASDASNYRVPPAVVVLPRTPDDVLAALDAARETGLALTARGAGTSVAGNAVGPGIVLDFSRHLNRIEDIDPGSRSARVQPGVVLADLQRATARHGLRFGPDPSTASRATLGGMIGNNACGPHAVAYGRTADNVVELDVVDGRGHRFTAGRGLDPVPGLADLVDSHLALIRTELGRFPRQVSGYSLEHLLPENGRALGRALVGTEGTAVLLLGATVDLVDIAPARVLLVLGYPDMAAAADAVPALLPHRPLAVEGLDARLVDVVRRHRGGEGVPALPKGAGWLMIEVGGADAAEAMSTARAVAADAGALGHLVVPAGAEAAALWGIRADGAGLAGRTPDGRPAWPGWEDAAVPPERLGDYLRAFDALLADHGVQGLPYGHFGDGCVHVRVDVPLERGGAALRAFVTDAARLVAAHGGSLSGEHGDGRARGELLPLMYSPEVLRLFAAFKGLFDPAGVLNPGVGVAPRPLDADLRYGDARPLALRDGYRLPADGGDLTRAVHRCTGVGKCRAGGASGGFMCPSYRVTRDEKDSTRGRARVLQEMANGTLVTGGWRAPEVHESLELCLSCKACASDCPAGVDMAAYKTQVLHESYRGRLRPPSHYALGWLPRWLRLLGATAPVGPALANALAQAGPLTRRLLPLAGLDARRSLPRVPGRPFSRRPALPRTYRAAERGRTVILWADCFSDALSPRVPAAAAQVLTEAGFTVRLPGGRPCCGLTWISTGQLTAARRRLRRLVRLLAPEVRVGALIVGLEPSCTAVLRSDLPELLGDEPDVAEVSRSVRTLAEVLMHDRPADSGWRPPDLSHVRAVVQPHCHQHAVLGFDADRRLLTEAGADITELSGCCGMAGNFGMEQGHYDLSVAVAETSLLPALRRSDEATLYMADGFSCRTQAQDLAGRAGLHLAELLADRRRSSPGPPAPDDGPSS